MALVEFGTPLPLACKRLPAQAALPCVVWGPKNVFRGSIAVSAACQELSPTCGVPGKLCSCNLGCLQLVGTRNAARADGEGAEESPRELGRG